MDTPLRAVNMTTETVEPSRIPYREYREPLRTWAGHGTGATCNECACVIQEHEIEFEIELPRGNNAPSLHFHFVCYRNWMGRRGR
jgi:hypothetical protein